MDSGLMAMTGDLIVLKLAICRPVSTSKSKAGPECGQIRDNLDKVQVFKFAS